MKWNFFMMYLTTNNVSNTVENVFIYLQFLLNKNYPPPPITKLKYSLIHSNLYVCILIFVLLFPDLKGLNINETLKLYVMIKFLFCYLLLKISVI